MSQIILDRLARGEFSRAELSKLRINAAAKASHGDLEAKAILNAIDDSPAAADKYILFMGFCPGANFDNRLDVEWRQQGFCYYHYEEDALQFERFQTILRGDLIILKKRHEFGRTMRLYGHGRVTGIRQGRYRDLQVDWAPEGEVITVPLMGCNSTVDIRTIDQVNADMPDEFHAWLSK